MSVTIGIPFLNAEATLGDAVRSVFAQSFTNWRLLLVDDGSSDGSLALARSIDDPRVAVISDGRNRGLAARLNQITSSADTDLLVRMDADDVMHPDRLTRQVEHLEAHPDVDIVGSAVYGLSWEGRIVNVRDQGPVDPDPRSVLLGSALMAHPTVAGRTEWFRRNPYDETRQRTEDRELWYRTCRHTVFDRVPEPLLFYRESGSTEGAEGLRRYLRTLRDWRGLVREKGPELVGPARTRLELLRFHLKAGIHIAAAATGLRSRILSRRGSPLDPEERTRAEQALAQVHATAVPGWEEAASA